MLFRGRCRCRVGGATETIIMGVSGKWIKALVGLKKSERSKSSEKDENVGAHLITLFNAFACSKICRTTSVFITLGLIYVLISIVQILVYLQDVRTKGKKR